MCIPNDLVKKMIIIIKKRGGLCTGTACIMNTELLATSTSVKSIIIKRGLSIYKPGTPFVVTYKRIRSENEGRKGSVLSNYGLLYQEYYRCSHLNWQQ